MKINITKINLAIILSTASITTAILLIFGDLEIHFFAIISIPLFILGLVNIKKIQLNLRPLLILLVLFPIITSIVRLNAAEPMRLLRVERDKRLTETDWMTNSDAPTMSTAWKNYRQALRDLPASADPKLDSNDDLTNVTWPTKP